MVKPATTGSGGGRAFMRRAGCILAAVAVALATLIAADPAIAQTATRPVGGTASQASTLPASLEGLAGVTPNMTVDQLVDAGLAAITSGRLEDGRKILLAAAARNGRNLRALSTLAFAYERSAEEARAGGTPRSTRDADGPIDADGFIDRAVNVYLTAGSVALDQDQVGVAEQFYNRILLHRPGKAKALLGLARIYAASDRKIQAIDRYKDYLNSPEGKIDAKAYLELAELHLDGMHWRLAMDLLARAQQIQPNDPDVQMALARAYQKGGQMSEAMDAAKKATDMAPDQPKYRNVLAELYLAQGDGEQASIEALRSIELTRKALQTSPDDVALLKELSRYYETYEKALRSLLNEGKANPVVRVDLARAIQEHAVADRTLALRRVLKVLTEVPAEGKDDVRLLEELVSVQRLLGMVKEARETCGRLLKVDPGNSTATRILKETEGAGER